uniref:Sugar phosphate phosphatase n=1 Tax=Ditylum brightwellii TaxID=49249 RepID=A0A6V2JBD9_9STRA|mmetsp:Transcript_27430/g.41087  ORF Transcript_27430/g.41087 Transcript_27430/m.41087 type:complete len:461 (-) Transcript_27430:207-1589(-)
MLRINPLTHHLHPHHLPRGNTKWHCSHRPASQVVETSSKEADRVTMLGLWVNLVDEEILQRTYEENEDEFNTPEFATALANMEALREELRNAATTKLRHLLPLSDEQAKDEERAEEWQQWHDMLNPYVEAGDTWLTAPWMVTEFFVYRRFMEAIGYFDPSNEATFMWDPFVKAKRAGLDTSYASAENLMEKVEALPNTKEGVELAAAFALWGNKMDLSIWPADAANSDVDVFSNVLAAAADNLLHDDFIILANHCETLREKKGGVVDIIVDNAGFELVTDLALADHLVASGVAREIRFQLKSHPTFVSDALEKDLMETIETYAALDESTYPFAKKAGQRWKSYIDNKSWTCHENSFWVQGAAMWEMPDKLSKDLNANCDLAFVKGDANYRRLLGDRYWDYTSPFQDVVGAYFPCPVCALRTLKAEVGCGMDKEQVERASSLDDNWLVNGRFGVVHFGTGV